jgi:uncharacterized protein YcbX
MGKQPKLRPVTIGDRVIMRKSGHRGNVIAQREEDGYLAVCTAMRGDEVAGRVWAPAEQLVRIHDSEPLDVAVYPPHSEDEQGEEV